MKTPVILIVGPTAVGKSEAALHLALKINGEIISADSMQIYQGMDIGTAKPGPEDRKKVPHHLIDLIPPTEEFSVFDYCRHAIRAIRDIKNRKKIPLVVGGTGLYVRALLRGIDANVGKNEDYRKRMENTIQTGGLEKQYERLTRLNPERARTINPGDKKRIIRALEMIEAKRDSKASQGIEPITSLGFQPILIGMTRPRLELYEAIERRVDQMMGNGFLDEVKALSTQPLSQTSSQAIGYRELLNFLNGAADLDSAIRQIKQNTRRFAKRQITWFKKEKDIIWFLRTTNTSPEELQAQIQNYLKGKI